MTNKPPATEGLAAGLAEFVLVPREPTPEWIKDMDVHLLSKYGAELGPAVAREMIANVLAAAPSPASSGETGEPRAIANRMREIIQDVWDKKEGYTDRQAWSDLHGQAMRLLGWEVATRALAIPEQKPGMVTVKPLVWREYSLPHDYGNGSWEANGVHGIYEILDVGGDPKNGLRYYLRGYSQFDTLDEAKAAAQADYTARILSAIEVTVKPLDRIACMGDMDCTCDAIKVGQTYYCPKYYLDGSRVRDLKQSIPVQTSPPIQGFVPIPRELRGPWKVRDDGHTLEMATGTTIRFASTSQRAAFVSMVALGTIEVTP